MDTQCAKNYHIVDFNGLKNEILFCWTLEEDMHREGYEVQIANTGSALSADDWIGVIEAFPDPKRELGAKWRGWNKATALGHL